MTQAAVTNDQCGELCVLLSQQGYKVVGAGAREELCGEKRAGLWSVVRTFKVNAGHGPAVMRLPMNLMKRIGLESIHFASSLKGKPRTGRPMCIRYRPLGRTVGSQSIDRPSPLSPSEDKSGAADFDREPAVGGSSRLRNTWPE
ncbi:hypothetical protein F2P81_007250 [Scophthalmus maximus]|uniref:Uncharacterized protein n=1 Tax=Scophthalmus maximus TaxID=52904 RepID=A0A6A4TGV6_SCOMX|nr:hypothetical protein F2P81_007250 [Scophthalmus maximus]